MTTGRTAVTVDGPPVTADVSWADVRAYLRARGWTDKSAYGGNEEWTCADPLPCKVYVIPRSPHLDVTIKHIAQHDRRHPADVLRDIARGPDAVGVEPLTEVELVEVGAGHRSYGISVVDVPRMLATVRAREAERDAIDSKLAAMELDAARHSAHRSAWRALAQARRSTGSEPETFAVCGLRALGIDPDEVA